MAKSIANTCVVILMMIWTAFNIILIPALGIACSYEGIVRHNWRFRIIGDYVRYWFRSYRKVLNMVF